MCFKFNPQSNRLFAKSKQNTFFIHKNKRHSNGLLTLFEYRFLLPAVVKKRLLKLFIPYFFRTFTR
nr:MAG TPA: hypothetical protein [Caudoviricetes sp.]